ncbi:MAG: family 10 glycosylhydrolase [Prevotella sp.]|nr:family 10 glycosylhydrolase [Prevotella sp.]
MKPTVTINLWKQFLLCLLLHAVVAQAATPFDDSNDMLPKRETRAVWLTTINGLDWPRSLHPDAQRRQLARQLDMLRLCGINTVLVQTRIRATTIYPSAMEPWDACLTGTPGRAPAYDPLQTVIDECHSRGMEVQAWIVTMPVGEWNSPGVESLRRRRPELVKRINHDAYMNPEAVGTAAYMADLCREVVSRYDIDGIHLDYIRYPEQWRGKKDRECITRIVRAVSLAVKGCKPWVKMSCSPVGKHSDLARYSSRGWNARDAMAQDAQLWLMEGLMDELYPMMYFSGNQFHPFAIDWAEHLYGGNVAAGLGIYFLNPREGHWPLDEVTRQMNVARSLHLGHCFFRTKFLLDNDKGIYDFVRWFNRTPALVPPMRSCPLPAPAAPCNMQRRLLQGADMLTWQAPTDENNDNGGILYNVYASDEWPVDTNRPDNIVAMHLRQTQVAVPVGRPRHYAVTAIDRYGQESQPIQEKEAQQTSSHRQKHFSIYKR